MARFSAARGQAAEARDYVSIFWASDVENSDEYDGADPEVETGAINASKHLYTGTAKLERFIADANASKADFVLITGDVAYHLKADYDLALPRLAACAKNSWWLIGNHDLKDAHAATYAELVTLFGLDNEPTVAGSKFNRVFDLERGGTNVRLICVDSNMDGNGDHHSTTTDARFTADERAWVEAQAEAAPTNAVVLVAAHHGPRGLHMSETEKANIAAMAANIESARPDLTLKYIYGHEHNNTTVAVESLSGTGMELWRAPALIDYTTGRYVELRVDLDGPNTRLVEFPWDG